jgi:hypothetical protein
MVIVSQEMPSEGSKKKDLNLTKAPATGPLDGRPNNTGTGPTQPSMTGESTKFVIIGNAVRINESADFDASAAAKMNLIVNASKVQMTSEGIEFVFETDKDMNFKRALVELAFKKTA